MIGAKPSSRSLDVDIDVPHWSRPAWRPGCGDSHFSPDLVVVNHNYRNHHVLWGPTRPAGTARPPTTKYDAEADNIVFPKAACLTRCYRLFCGRFNPCRLGTLAALLFYPLPLRGVEARGRSCLTICEYSHESNVFVCSSIL